MPSLSIGILLSAVSGSRHGSQTGYPEFSNEPYDQAPNKAKQLPGFKGFTCEDNGEMKKRKSDKPKKADEKLCGECETDKKGVCRPKTSLARMNPIKRRKCKRYCVAEPSGDKWYGRDNNIRTIQESIENLDELDISQEHTILCYDVQKQKLEKVEKAKTTVDKPCKDTDSKTGYMIKVLTKKEEAGVLPIVSAYPISHPEFRAATARADIVYEQNRTYLEIEEVETHKEHSGKRLALLIVTVQMSAFKSKRKEEVQLDNASLLFWTLQGREHKEMANRRFPGGNVKTCRSYFAGTKAYLTASLVAGFHLFKRELVDRGISKEYSEYEPIVDGLERIEQEIKNCEKDSNYDNDSQIAEEWDAEMIFSSNPNASHVADNSMFLAHSNAANMSPEEKHKQVMQEYNRAMNQQMTN